MTRKDFVTLAITLVGGAAFAGACSSSGNTPADGGGGSGGSGGSSGGASGSGGSASGGSGGANRDAATDNRADAAGDTGPACADPLPAGQVADATAHTHALVILAETLDATTDQMLQTGPFPEDSGGHTHIITLTVANLATIKAGGMVTVTSTMSGDTPHMHMFTVACRR